MEEPPAESKSAPPTQQIMVMAGSPNGHTPYTSMAMQSSGGAATGGSQQQMMLMAPPPAMTTYTAPMPVPAAMPSAMTIPYGFTVPSSASVPYTGTSTPCTGYPAMTAGSELPKPCQPGFYPHGKSEVPIPTTSTVIGLPTAQYGNF